MSLSTRLVVAFAAVAAVVALLVGILSYEAASDRITGEIDRTLQSATTSIASGQDQVLAPVAAPRRGDGDDDDRRPPKQAEQRLVAQKVSTDGTPQALGGRPVELPVDDTTKELAASGTAGDTNIVEVTVDTGTYRVLTTALGSDEGALQVASDIDGTNRVLDGMAIEIGGVSAGVLVLAAGAGWLLARRITRRLVRLTALTERVSARGTVDEDVPIDGGDEVGRLSRSFNTMLGRIVAGREAQERLVQDAAHELRTPLTSLRTNASVMRRFRELTVEEQDELLEEVAGETRELSNLVDELVELALARREDEAETPVDLGEVSERAAARVRRRTGRTVLVHSDHTWVQGRPSALERAISNLLENAAKFDTVGGEPIEAVVADGRIAVSDRGPGIAGTDTEKVFDRFFRADSARGLPGSGLGLSIVRDVAESHGGRAFAEARSGGGATVGFVVDHARLLPSSDLAIDGASPSATTVDDV